MLSSNFVGSRFLEGAAGGKLLERLPGLGIAGGAVYDALVGAAAAHHGMRLATRDRRALDTYRALDVELEILA